MEVKKDIMWRINGSFIIMCVFGLVILGQIVRIQFVEGDKWKALADSFTFKYFNTPASRGNIFSSDGRLLSTSIPIYDIRMDLHADGMTKKLFDDGIDSLSIGLADLFKDRSSSEYKRMIKEARADKERYFLVHRNVRYPELQVLKTFPLFRLGKYKGGFLLEQKEIREMPFKMLAARTIGYMRDVKPVGIESSFNQELKGEGGKRLMQKMSGAVWMPVTDKEQLEPRDGNDLVTTIDVSIQDVAESALEEHLRAHNADHGCAVLMEVATGEIKAIANLSRNDAGGYSEEFNYVIGEATEPGSTIKLASLLAALDDGYVELNDTINVGSGVWSYYGQPMKDSHAPKSSRLSVQRCFETSSNVGVSKIVWQNYAKRPQAYINKLKSFGLDVKLNLEIEGEGMSRIKNTTDKDWSPVSLPWISIGYEVALTPLQILTFYNAVANNGRVVKPRLVKEIRNHGRVIKSFPVVILRDSIASPEALKKARKMMEGVVQNGTASSLSKSPYKIAGKTGTAQIVNNKFGYDKSHRTYQASFVGYFPADAPKYSCMVVVYAPGNDVFFGGAVAAPVFKEIADKVYSNHLDIHTQPSDSDTVKITSPLAKVGMQKETRKVMAALNVAVVTTDPDAHIVSTAATSDGVIFSKRKIMDGLVPSVTGMGAADAVFILENAGLRVNVRGRGNVVRQSLEPGKKINKGQTILLDLNF